MTDRLDDRAPVLVDKYNVGHRPTLWLEAACGTGLPLACATALQATGWSTMPCVDAQCWRGERPW